MSIAFYTLAWCVFWNLYIHITVKEPIYFTAFNPGAERIVAVLVFRIALGIIGPCQFLWDVYVWLNGGRK